MKNAIWDHARGWAEKVQFSCLALCFCCIRSRSQISPQLTNDPSYWGPWWGFIDLGSWKPYLWNIILAPISHPIDLLPYPMHSKYLQWCLEHSKYSRKILLTRWSWGLRLKESFCVRGWESGAVGTAPHTSWRNRGRRRPRRLERDLESENLGWISH